MSARANKKTCLGAFAGAHGVRGEAKIKTFTAEAENIAAYGPVTSEDGKRRFTLTVVKTLKDGFVLARAPEIASREDAEALKGVRLYVDRSASRKKMNSISTTLWALRPSTRAARAPAL